MFIIRQLKLRAKILAVSGTFLAGMVCIILGGGYAIVQQYNAIEEAVNTSYERVSASSKVNHNILAMDRAIQALIANDDPTDMRTAAIASIRAGAILDEELAKLKASYGDDQGVASLVTDMKALRPKQLQIIGKARANDDEAALSLAASISDEFTQIANMSEAWWFEVNRNWSPHLPPQRRTPLVFSLPWVFWPALVYSLVSFSPCSVRTW